MIYSSGSVKAQRLLFEYTKDGDVRPLISGYFDTVNAGSKIESGSYGKIVENVGGKGERWLFLSDNVREVGAARGAGMRSFVVVREGNAVLSQEEGEGEVLVGRLDELVLL